MNFNLDFLNSFFYKILFLDKVDSTNDFIKNLLKKEYIDYNILVFAKNQLKGRGRRNNIWYSNKESLKFSIGIFNFLKDKNFINFLYLIPALSIVKALKEFNYKTYIKWPNDIFYRDRKLAGILVENVFKPDKIVYTIIGIGINFDIYNFPKEILAISLDSKEVNKERFLNKFFYLFIDYLNNINNFNLKDEFFNFDYLYNKNIIVYTQSNKVIEKGIAKGISNTGTLIIKTKNGLKEIYNAYNIKILDSGG